MAISESTIDWIVDPNWASEISRTRSFASSKSTSRFGVTQRGALRQTPLIVMQYQALMSRQEATDKIHRLKKRLSTFYVPNWTVVRNVSDINGSTDTRITGAASGSGAYNLIEYTANTRESIAVGDRVCVWKDRDNYTTGEVTQSANGYIVIDNSVDWYSGPFSTQRVCLYKMFESVVSVNSTQWESDRVARASFVCTSAQASDLSEATIDISGLNDLCAAYTFCETSTPLTCPTNWEYEACDDTLGLSNVVLDKTQTNSQTIVIEGNCYDKIGSTIDDTTHTAVDITQLYDDCADCLPDSGGSGGNGADNKQYIDCIQGVSTVIFPPDVTDPVIILVEDPETCYVFNQFTPDATTHTAADILTSHATCGACLGELAGGGGSGGSNSFAGQDCYDCYTPDTICVTLTDLEPLCTCMNCPGSAGSRRPTSIANLERQFTMTRVNSCQWDNLDVGTVDYEYSLNGNCIAPFFNGPVLAQARLTYNGSTWNLRVGDIDQGSGLDVFNGDVTGCTIIGQSSTNQYVCSCGAGVRSKVTPNGTATFSEGACGS